MTQIDDILELVRTGAIIPETNVAILAREVERLREEMRELRAFARISGYPEGRFSFEVPFDKDMEEWGTDIARRFKISREEEQVFIDSLPVRP